MGHSCHTHRTAISYGSRASTVVSGGLWWNDWKLVSGLWMGISEAIFVSGKHASAATGVMNTGGNVVGGIGALLVPVTAEVFGWVPALATGSGFAIIGVGI